MTLEFVILRWAFADLEISGNTEQALPLLYCVSLRKVVVLLSVWIDSLVEVEESPDEGRRM